MRKYLMATLFAVTFFGGVAAANPPPPPGVEPGQQYVYMDGNGNLNLCTAGSSSPCVPLTASDSPIEP